MKKVLFIILFLPLFLVASFKETLTTEEKNWLDNQKIITIGAMDNWAPINFVDYKNKASGIGASIVEILNTKLDNKLQINSADWSSIYEKAKNSQLNAILDITPKKEREEFFYFTKPYLQIPHVIVSKNTQKPFLSLADLNGKTVALEENVGTITDLQNNYPKINIKTFKNTTHALDAVSRGLADAYIGNRTVVNYKIKEELIDNIKIDSIDSSRKSSILSIGVSKQFPILFSILQKAMDEISAEQWNEIRIKWEDKTVEVNDNNQKVELTNEEKAWLEANPVIKYAANPNSMPYESFDESGNYIGIISQHLNLLEKTLGIKFEKIKTNNIRETFEKIKENKIDIFSNYWKLEEKFQDDYVSIPLDVKTPIVISGKKNKNQEFIVSLSQVKNEKIAVVKDFFYLKEIYKLYPNLNYVEVENATIAFQGVSSGTYDLALCSLPLATYTISSLGLINVEIIGKTDTYMQLSFFIKKELVVFRNILEKVLSKHFSSELYEIMGKWETVTKKPQINYSIIIQSFGLIFFGLIFLVVWNYQLKRQVSRKTTELSKLLKFFDENVIASKTDLSGNITYVSDAFCKISKYSRESLIGQNHRITKHEDNNPEIFKELWETITKGKVWRGRIKNKTKNGGYYWVDTVIERDYDFNGKVIGYVSLRHEVTAQVELEKLSENLEDIIRQRTIELYRLNTQQNAVFNTVNVGILFVKNRIIQEINNKTCQIFGYEYDEIIEAPTEMLYINKEDFEKVQLHYEVVKRGEVTTWEQMFIKKDGTKFWARSTMQAIDINTLSKGVVVTIDDITLEKLALEEIKKQKF